MTTPTDVVPHHGGQTLDMGALEVEMRYADVIANSDLVPVAYRKKPGNVLVAWGLGAAMGLDRMESLYRIDVIQGKPCASSELIASNVRKAGHKLRTVVNEAEQWAETTIIRCDDPDNPVTVRRDMQWAKRMGLAQKENYVKQLTTMLSYRSITGAARLACPEALYGVQYTADELQDLGPAADEKTRGPVTAATFTAPKAEEPAMPVLNAAPGKSDAQDAPVTPEQIADLSALFEQAGFETDARTTTFREQRAEYMTEVLGTEVKSTRDITPVQADQVIEALREFIAGREDDQ